MEPVDIKRNHWLDMRDSKKPLASPDLSSPVIPATSDKIIRPEDWTKRLSGIFISSPEVSNPQSPRLDMSLHPSPQSNGRSPSPELKTRSSAFSDHLNETNCESPSMSTESDLLSPGTISALVANIQLDSPITVCNSVKREEVSTSVNAQGIVTDQSSMGVSIASTELLYPLPETPRLKPICELERAKLMVEIGVETDLDLLEGYLVSMFGKQSVSLSSSDDSVRQPNKMGSYIGREIQKSGSFDSVGSISTGSSMAASESSVGSLGSIRSEDSLEKPSLSIVPERVKTSPEPVHHIPTNVRSRNPSRSPTKLKPPSTMLPPPSFRSNSSGPPSAVRRAASKVDKKIRFTNFTCLLDAAIEGDLQEVKQLVEFEDVHPDSCNADGVTAIHCAAGMGLLEMAQYLLEMGANVNVADDHGWTPLHSACYVNHVPLTKLLLKAGADIEAHDMDDQTPIMLATDAEILTLISDATKKKNTSEYVTAIYNFDRSDLKDAHGDELSIKKGDKLRIIDRADHNWWRAERQKLVGLIPRQFVQ